MNLLIISAMPHFLREGTVVGWAPTATEIDHLATIFDSIRHVAFLHREPAPNAAIPYESPRITLVPVRPSGGSGVWAKLQVLRTVPEYLYAILSEMTKADVVHVRGPANISLVALVVLFAVRRPKPRWAKYAGNWVPDGQDPISYRFERWWLKRGFHRGLVTVNGRWEDNPSHVRHFLNPCLTREEYESASRIAEKKKLNSPPVLLYAGRLETAKGVGRAIRILRHLHDRGIHSVLHLAGDGPERKSLESEVHRMKLTESVFFHGWLARNELLSFYAKGDFFVMPCTSSEGWPKAISEAMAFGVVPLAGRLSSIPQLLAESRTGKALDACDTHIFAEAIAAYISRPDTWRAESSNALQAARQFLYDYYIKAVRQLLNLEIDGQVTGGSQTPC